MSKNLSISINEKRVQHAKDAEILQKVDPLNFVAEHTKGA